MAYIKARCTTAGIVSFRNVIKGSFQPFGIQQWVQESQRRQVFGETGIVQQRHDRSESGCRSRSSTDGDNFTLPEDSESAALCSDVWDSLNSESVDRNNNSC